MKSYNICLSVSDLFQFKKYPLGPSTLLQMARFPSFLFQCVCVCVFVYHLFFTHQCMNMYLGYFHILVIINNAAMNKGTHVSFQIRVYVYFRLMPRSEIAGLYNSFIFKFFEEPPYCFPM